MAITITEILAEAFNRIKTEHGVTLSRVDFDNSGCVDFSARSNPQVLGVVKRQQWQGIDWAGRDVAPVPLQPHQIPAPKDATHYGTVNVYDDCFWKFEAGNLYVWDRIWQLYDDGESAQRTVDSQLTPLK